MDASFNGVAGKSSGRLPSRVCFLDQTGELGGAELCLMDIVSRLTEQQRSDGSYAADLESGRQSLSKVILFNDGPFRERLEASRVPVSVVQAPNAISSIKRNGGHGRELRAGPALIKLARRVAAEAGESEVLFANTQKAMVVGTIASRIAGKPLIWYLHDIITSDHFGRVNRLLNVFLGSFFVSRIITNSAASKSAFLMGGGRHRHIRVIPNGFDPEPFDEVDEDQLRALRWELGLTTAPIVGVFSRLAPWKGQRVLIEALAALPGVQALIVGKALFRGEQEYLDELERLARAKGVADRIHFLGFRDDVANLMKLCDVIVHTSIAPEPFGRVIVEAMLAGKPVIATRGGGASEIVEHLKTGILVNAGDSNEMANAVRVFLDHPGVASGMARAGRERALKCYSVGAMLAAIDEEIHHASVAGR